MKTTKRNSILAMTLLASLTLPGLALAEIWKQPPQHNGGGQHRPSERVDYRGHDRGHDHDRHDRDDWRERYEHAYYYRHAPRVVYGAPVVYPAPAYRVYPGVYPGAYTGVPPAVYAPAAVVTPSFGFVINLR